MRKIILAIIIPALMLVTSVPSFAQEKVEPSKKLYVIAASGIPNKVFFLEDLEAVDF